MMVLIFLILFSLLSSFAQQDHPIRLKIIGYDEKNKPILSGVLNLESLIQKQEESCIEGMGELRGYCGIYQGLVSEEDDQAGKCDLIRNTVSLSLDPNGSINLYSGMASTEVVKNEPFFISRINYDPKNTTIELSNRECRPINGIKFPNDNCKRLRLAGAFNYYNRSRHFSGFFSAMDERTGQSCRYRLSFDHKD